MNFKLAALSLAALRLVAAATIDVTVGGADASGNPMLVFSPEAVFANAGDVVNFHFAAKNHSAVQGSFAGPCSALTDASGAPVFDSGFHPTAAGATGDVVTFNVVDTKPVWFHCAQTGHCGKGMVFAINCGADGQPNSFTNFKAAALAIGAAQASSAAAASTAPPAAATGTGTPTVYGSYTVPPDPAINTVTATIVVESSTWTTTYASYAGSPDATPSALGGVVHKVTVGASGLTFDPAHIVAAPRDTIVFEFHAKNHTVTQSSFAAPCKKLDTSADTGLPGIDSGFNNPVATDATTFPTWNVTVNGTAPLWFYCKQPTGNHCGAGMVFAVNSDETSARNFAAFQALAETINGTTAGAAAPTKTAGGRPVAVVSLGALSAVAGVMAFLL